MSKIIFKFIALALFVNNIMLMAQVDISFPVEEGVVSLNTPAYKAPEFSYFKDLNNELDPFVGTWQLTHKGRTTILVITKERYVPFEIMKKRYYRDQIIVKYEIKDTTGKVLEDTINNTFENERLKIVGYKFDNSNKIMAIFYGGNCSLGNGLVYLGKQGNAQLSWTYYPQAITVTDATKDDCQGDVYLPIGRDLIFTKQ